MYQPCTEQNCPICFCVLNSPKSSDDLQKEPTASSGDPSVEPIGLIEGRDQKVYKTVCGHIFCNDCVKKLVSSAKSTQPLCPLCRRRLEPIEKNKKQRKHLPFQASNYPFNPSFDFIQNEGDRRMIQNAYECISKHNGWDLLHSYEVEETHEFMFNGTNEIVDLMHKVDEHYGNHSGNSLTYAMHFVHLIACLGFQNFENFCRFRVSKF